MPGRRKFYVPAPAEMLCIGAVLVVLLLACGYLVWRYQHDLRQPHPVPGVEQVSRGCCVL